VESSTADSSLWGTDDERKVERGREVGSTTSPAVLVSLARLLRGKSDPADAHVVYNTTTIRIDQQIESVVVCSADPNADIGRLRRGARVNIDLR
jgi:hypothetical protein